MEMNKKNEEAAAGDSRKGSKQRFPLSRAGNEHEAQDETHGRELSNRPKGQRRRRLKFSNLRELQQICY